MKNKLITGILKINEGKIILHVYFSNNFHISTEIRDNMTVDDILSAYSFLKLKQEQKYQKDYYDE